jgi:hypothetical protein
MPDPKLRLNVRDLTPPGTAGPSEDEERIVEAVVLTVAAATRSMPGHVRLSILMSLILTTIHHFQNPQDGWAEVSDAVAKAIERKRLGEQ